MDTNQCVSNADSNEIRSGEGSALIFMGTGCSSGVPSPRCLMRPSDPPCDVCHKAMSSPPKTNRNYRCNPSLLIDYEQEDGQHYYILIDVGKDFKEQVLRWFLHYKIPRLDVIILTHEHADAMLGLDDVKGVQPCNPTNDIDHTPIFLNQFTMDSVAARFPYLVPKTSKERQELLQVAQLDFKIIENDCERPFNVADLQFTPLPVMHGEDYLSLGFLFGKKSRVAYVSDVSRFPERTEYVISKSGGGQVDLLILDTLSKKRPHSTHFYLPEVCIHKDVTWVKRGENMAPNECLIQIEMGNFFSYPSYKLLVLYYGNEWMLWITTYPIEMEKVNVDMFGQASIFNIRSPLSKLMVPPTSWLLSL